MLELIKPITWFPPMWAYLCSVIAAGVSPWVSWPLVVLGVLLAGPVVCGMSQAANDWCDRFVDAVNEPQRPIPSGRIPGRWGLWIALAMTAVSLARGWFLGPWGFAATGVGVAAVWAYSAEPVRLKQSVWWGPGLVGLCYEGLPWFTGAAVLAQGLPTFPVITLALLYAFGAHGIMTLNDFKALDGDRLHGVRSLPVTLLAIAAAGQMAGGAGVIQPAVMGLGFCNGMFAVAAIGSMMALAGESRAAREGTRMGLWGGAQAVAAGAGGLVGAAGVDLARHFMGAASGFGQVFVVGAGLFAVATVLAARVIEGRGRPVVGQMVPGE